MEKKEEGKMLRGEKNCQIEFPTKHVSEPSSDNKHNVGIEKLSSVISENNNNNKKGTRHFLCEFNFHHICSAKKI